MQVTIAPRSPRLAPFVASLGSYESAQNQRHYREAPMTPTSKHGKICYLQIPAVDVDTSAAFYAEIFGWKLRQHDDGTQAFDDTVGEVSGMWVTSRKPWTGDPGLQVDIMVDNAEETLAAIVAHGGEVVKPIGWQAPEITAVFRDPAGNLLGIYQEPVQ